MQNNKPYLTGSIVKSMLAFVGPFMLSMVLQSLYGAVDLLLVGRFATTADVAAVAVGSQLMFMVTQLIIGLTTAATVLIGNHYGAGNADGLRRTMGAQAVLFGIIGAGLCLAYFCCVPLMASAMQTPPQARPAALAYLYYCSAGILFIMGFNICGAAWIGIGDTRSTFLCIAVACATNVLLDLALVGGLKMGAAGAAIATLIAQACCFGFALFRAKRRGFGFAFSRRDIRRDRRSSLELLRVGLPLGLQNTLVSFSFLFITAVINLRGVAPAAAAGVVEKLFSFLIMPASAFGTAVATVAAQNIGAGQLARAKQALWAGVGLALVPSVLAVLLCQLLGLQVAGLFTRDTQVMALAAEYMRSYTLDCITLSLVFCMGGYFNSMGYSWFTMFHSLLATFLFRVPLTWLLSRLPGAGLFTIGLAPPLATLVSLGMCLLFLRRVNRLGPALAK